MTRNLILALVLSITSFGHSLSSSPLPPEIKYELAAPLRLRVTPRGSFITVESQDIVAQKNRAEIKVMGVGHTGGIFWYSYELVIPPSYADGNGYAILGQLHDGPPFPTGAHPPLLAMRYADGCVDFVYGTEPPARFHSEAMPFARGVWHRVTWRVDWSTTIFGTADVWLDGLPIKHFLGANAYGDEEPYIKWGVYRPEGGAHSATVVYRNVRVSNVPLIP